MFEQHNDEPHAEDVQADSELTVNRVLTDLNLSNFAELFAEEQIDIDSLVSYFYFLICFYIFIFIFNSSQHIFLYYQIHIYSS